MLAALVCGAAVFPGLFFGFRKILKHTRTQWSEADVTVVSESHWLVNSFVLFGVPYMVFDIYAMYLSHFHTERSRAGSKAPSGHSLQTVRAFLRKDWMLVLHHTALVFIFTPITLFFRRGLGDFFIGCMFITELSTPFVSIGKILIQLRLDGTKLHKINGLIVLLSFFTCRILLFPFMYWMYGRQFGISLHRVAFHLPLHCNVGNLVLLAPQVYWFILLLRKAQRLYLRQRRPQVDEDVKKAD